jgi:hypothetical protein
MAGKKKIQCIALGFLIVAFTVSLFGCGDRSREKMMALYQDEESLQTPYSSYVMESGSSEIDGHCMSGEISGLNGMVLVWWYESDDENTAYSLTYSMHVTAGKAKIILVSPDESIRTIAEYDAYDGAEDVREAFSVTDGLSRIKIVGTNDADLTFEISVNGGDLIKVTK